MSSAKGNIKRTRPQKHQNRMAFRNNLHDNSVKIKFINSIQPSGICSRCKDIIDWKIKYKKYKPLTAPKKCVRCEEKAVKHAYHTMCLPCSRKEKVCAKCCKAEEIVEAPPVKTPAEEEEMRLIIKALPERKRRTLLRYIRKQNGDNKKNRKRDRDVDEATKEEKKLDLAGKINKLKLEAQSENIEDYDSDFCDSESDFSESENSDNEEDDSDENEA